MRGLKRLVSGALERVDPDFMAQLFRQAQKVPLLKRRIEREYDKLLAGVASDLKPYQGEFPAFKTLPHQGLERAQILESLTLLAERERDKWQQGQASGAVYHGASEHIDFLNRVYALHSQSNPLHADIWPSANKFEAEIVSMTAHMLGAREATSKRSDGRADIRGVVTSGGTESILLAMKAYRDYAANKRSVIAPEMVVPETAHAAFDKAAQFFKIKKVSVPVNEHFVVDVERVSQAITKNTICLVASAPAFPHGVIDPVPELAEIAERHRIGLHVDACLGGFILPWAKELGYAVPDFDFRVPGVSSISVDTHKYGYAAKGTSVVLYRDRELLHEQYFTVTDWPGGLYFSPTLAGSRPGGLSAACWAAMVSMGAQGYLDAARRILETASEIRRGIEGIRGLRVLGNPLWVIAFASDELDIYRVMEEMSHRGWSLNGLHKPGCLHLCVTLRHTEPGVVTRFLSDLREGVEAVRANPGAARGMAPMYGLAASLPVRGAVSEMMKRYLDLMFQV